VIFSSNLVVEVAVIGVKDGFLGHRLVALAVPRNGDSTTNNILRYCMNALPRYKVPSEVVFVRALPKNASGKIDRNKCMEKLLGT